MIIFLKISQVERPTWHILLVMKHDPYTDCILWLPICLNTLNTDFFLILFFFKEHDDSSGTLLTQARGGRRGGRARHQQRDAKGSSPSPAPGEKSLKARSPSRTGLASSWHWSPTHTSSLWCLPPLTPGGDFAPYESRSRHGAQASARTCSLPEHPLGRCLPPLLFI